MKKKSHLDFFCNFFAGDTGDTGDMKKNHISIFFCNFFAGDTGDTGDKKKITDVETRFICQDLPVTPVTLVTWKKFMSPFFFCNFFAGDTGDTGDMGKKSHLHFFFAIFLPVTPVTLVTWEKNHISNFFLQFFLPVTLHSVLRVVLTLKISRVNQISIFTSGWVV